MDRLWDKRASIALACMLLVTGVLTGCRKVADVAAVREKAAASGKKAVQWLETQQRSDGSFEDSEYVKVGITSLAIIALMDHDLNEDDPEVKRAVAFLAAQQQDGGSICVEPQAENYQTALAMIALRKTGNRAYDEALKKAQAFLVRLQSGEGDGITPDDARYGGIGYGSRPHPDLSNTQFALEALRATELGADAGTFQRAVLFIERCQNLRRVNEQPWATNDGGFVYYPGLSQANPDATGGEPRHSYGSMTYAGLLSFSYCDVPRDDPRVQAALDWLREHYTVDKNPGMGYQGLYYYYMVMAKALSAYGEKYLVDNKGRKHYWALDLANKLIALQHPEGYWVNSESDRWMEDNKSLVTAYCMIALDRCRPFLTEQ